jgi:hypothetical protein
MAETITNLRVVFMVLSNNNAAPFKLEQHDAEIDNQKAAID